jgi:HEXXH motif-containing protein
MRSDDLAHDVSAQGLPDLTGLVLPRSVDGVRANALLHRVVSRQYLVRWARALRRLRGVGLDASGHAMAQNVLAAATVDQALELASRPDVTAWIWRSESRHADQHVLDRDLANRLFGDALALGCLEPGEAADLLVDGLLLWPQGGRANGGDVLSDLDPESAVTCGADAQAPRLRSVATVELPRGSRMVGCPVLLPTDSLMSDMGEVDEPVADLDDEVALHFASVVQDGVKVLEGTWPTGLDMISIDVRAVAPLRSYRGLRPLNYSIHGLRGLVCTSKRPDYMLAQTLVHEATHNRFSGILDCTAVVENPESTHFSPFVDAIRPLGYLLHGVLSFVNDVYAAQSYLAGPQTLDPEVSKRVERYVEAKMSHLDLAFANLTSVARPTTAGAQLLAGCDEALKVLHR